MYLYMRLNKLTFKQLPDYQVVACSPIHTQRHSKCNAIKNIYMFILDKQAKIAENSHINRENVEH